MNKNQFGDALEQGNSGKMGRPVGGIDYNLSLGIPSDKLHVYLSMLLGNGGGMFNSLFIGTRGWNNTRALVSLIKRGSDWQLTDDEFEYTALFDYRYQTGSEMPSIRGDGERVDPNDNVDFDKWYDRYTSAIMRSAPLLTIRLTCRGNYSNISEPVINTPTTIWNEFSRIRGINTSSSRRFNSIDIDCTNANSYRSNTGELNVEFSENTGMTLRVPAVRNKALPVEIPYTGWIPTELGKTIISQAKTEYFSLNKLAGIPKASLGNSIYSRTKNNILHFDAPVELTFSGTIYSIPKGRYFIGREEKWEDTIAYDNWLSALSAMVTISPSANKEHLLTSLESSDGRTVRKVIGRNIVSIGDTDDGPRAHRGSGSKITKM